MTTHRPDDDRPTHLHANSGEKRSLCGIKDAMPYMLARFVPMHQAGRAKKNLPPLNLCEACETAAKEYGA